LKRKALFNELLGKGAFTDFGEVFIKSFRVTRFFKPAKSNQADFDENGDKTPLEGGKLDALTNLE
jgi:hypothetical protein